MKKEEAKDIPIGGEIAVRQTGVPYGWLYRRTEPGYLLADGTALLECERDSAGRYKGGAGLDGVYLHGARLSSVWDTVYQHRNQFVAQDKGQDYPRNRHYDCIAQIADHGKDPGVPCRRGRPHIRRNLPDFIVNLVKHPVQVAHDETGRVYDADLEDISQRQEQLWEGVQKILAQLSKLS